MNAEQQYIDLFSQTEAMICQHSTEVMNTPRATALCRLCSGLAFLPANRRNINIPMSASSFEPDYGLNLNRLDIPVNPYEVFKCDVPNMSTSLYFVVNDAFYNKSATCFTSARRSYLR